MRCFVPLQCVVVASSFFAFFFVLYIRIVLPEYKIIQRYLYSFPSPVPEQAGMKRFLEEEISDRPAKRPCSSRYFLEDQLPESLRTMSAPLPRKMEADETPGNFQELRPDVQAAIPGTPTISGRSAGSPEAYFTPLPASMLPTGSISPCPCPCGCGRDPLAPLEPAASDLEPLAMLFFTNGQFRDMIVTDAEYCYSFLQQFPYMEEVVEEEVMWHTLPGSPDDLVELFYTESDFRSLIARNADVRGRFLNLCPEMWEDVEYEMGLQRRLAA